MRPDHKPRENTMTREELEQQASEQRANLYAVERRLERYKKADAIRDTSIVLGINNTTISWSGNGGITDPALVKRIRDLIAAAVEAGSE